MTAYRNLPPRKSTGPKSLTGNRDGAAFGRGDTVRVRAACGPAGLGGRLGTVLEATADQVLVSVENKALGIRERHALRVTEIDVVRRSC